MTTTEEEILTKFFKCKAKIHYTKLDELFYIQIIDKVHEEFELEFMKFWKKLHINVKLRYLELVQEYICNSEKIELNNWMETYETNVKMEEITKELIFNVLEYLDEEHPLTIVKQVNIKNQPTEKQIKERLKEQKDKKKAPNGVCEYFDSNGEYRSPTEEYFMDKNWTLQDSVFDYYLNLTEDEKKILTSLAKQHKIKKNNEMSNM